MKKVFTILALTSGSLAATAQQDPQFSQYMHNRLFFNPAYAGMRHAACFTMIARNQWNGFSGAPNSGDFTSDIWLYRWGGAGLNVMYDKLGFETNLSYRLDYSFHVEDVFGGTLGIGAEFGAYSKRVGPAGGEQWLANTSWQNDPSIPPQLRQTKFDLGLGVWYQRKNLWFGISTTHLPASVFTGASAPNPVSHPLAYHLARHYFVTGGFNQPLANPDWEIRSSFLVKSDAVVTTFDVNATALFRNRFWVGASYRSWDAVVPMAGFQVWGSSKNPEVGLKMGFAYDYTVSQLRNYSNGSFEVFVNICIPIDWVLGTPNDTRLFD